MADSGCGTVCHQRRIYGNYGRDSSEKRENVKRREVVGKVSTAVLYVVMFILILAPNIQEQIANTLIVLSGFLLLMSFILYIPVYKKILSEA